MTTIAAMMVWWSPSGLAKAPSPKKKAAKPAPTFTIKTASKVNRQAEIASIEANIENQVMILELEPRSGPNYPKMKIALADFYWDLSEVHDREAESDSLDEAMFQAEKKKDQGALAKLKEKQQALYDLRDKNRRLTIKLYREVVDEFPKAKQLDEILYYLGYHLMLMAEGDEGRRVYTQLVLDHPNSRYVPDAFVNIGEFYFDSNEFANAYAIYEKAAEFTDSSIYGYAVYKQAWCLYNMGRYAESLDRMLRVIKIANAQKTKGVDRAIDLRREAENNLIMPYAKVGKATAALAFFQKYTGTRYLELCGRLAEVYATEEEWDRSNTLLRVLIKEAQRSKGAAAQRYLVIHFQRLLVENAHTRGLKADTVAEVQELIRHFENLQSSAPPEWIAKEARGIDDLIVQIASAYHDEYESTKTQKTLEYTAVLYRDYLRLFRDKPNAYKISMNTALLLLLTKRHEEAAAEFERVIAMQPDGAYADDAAERSVVAYLRVLQGKLNDNNEMVDTAQDDVTKRELDGDAQRFIQAVDRWDAVIARKGLNPDTADNIPKARFLAAKFYYTFNHFEESAKRMARFLDQHAKHPLAEDAALYLLSAYNVSHDADNLHLWANKIAKMPHLGTPEITRVVTDIRNEFEYQQCFKHEKKEAFLRAAGCFMDYAKEFPRTKKTAESIYNASINYYRAKKVELALVTQQKLYEKYRNKDPLAPKAFYAMGEIFRETTVYDEAAKIYEYFFANHSSHKLAEKALRYASIFRKTLGQFDAAVRNLSTYLKKYRSNANAARVHLDIITIREKQKRWKKVKRAI